MFAALSSNFAAGVDGVKTRVSESLAGKKLLDEGGEPMESVIIAKKTASDATVNDADILQSMETAVKIYAEAALLLRAQDPQAVEAMGIAGSQDFESLAKDYEERSKLYSTTLAMLTKPCEAPPMTTSEIDAARILKVKGNYRWAREQTSAGYEVLSNSAASTAQGVGAAAAAAETYAKLQKAAKFGGGGGNTNTEPNPTPEAAPEAAPEAVPAVA